MSETFPAYISSDQGLERIYDGIEAVLPGVQHEVVRLAAWDALQEFCQHSAFWRMTLPWTLAAGEGRVDLNKVNPLARVLWVLAVRGMNYRLAPPATLVDMGSNYGSGRAGTAYVACGPLRLGEGALPSSLVDDWNEVLRDGTLFRLYGHPAKPYSAPPLMQFHGRRWRAGINRAKLAAREQMHEAPRFAYFAAGRHSVGRGWAGPEPVGTSMPSVVGSPYGSGGLGQFDGPLISLTTTDFAPVPLGEIGYATVTIRNQGSAPLVITGIDLTGGFSLVTPG